MIWFVITTVLLSGSPYQVMSMRIPDGLQSERACHIIADKMQAEFNTKKERFVTRCIGFPKRAGA